MFFTAWMGFEDGSSSCLVLLKSRSRSLSGGFSMPRWCVLRARRRVSAGWVVGSFLWVLWWQRTVRCSSLLASGFGRVRIVASSSKSEIVILLGGLDEWVTRKL
ncbi:unnamed protein product [Brassica oleracea]